MYLGYVQLSRGNDTRLMLVKKTGHHMHNWSYMDNWEWSLLVLVTSPDLWLNSNEVCLNTSMSDGLSGNE